MKLVAFTFEYPLYTVKFHKNFIFVDTAYLYVCDVMIGALFTYISKWMSNFAKYCKNKNLEKVVHVQGINIFKTFFEEVHATSGLKFSFTAMPRRSCKT